MNRCKTYKGIKVFTRQPLTGILPSQCFVCGRGMNCLEQKAGARCDVCGRFIKYHNPRRALPGSTERKYHAHSGSNHTEVDDEQSGEE